MATITGYTSARMLAIENNTVVDGDVVGDDLVLSRFDGSTINAGSVRGPVGPAGPAGGGTPDDNTVSTAKLQDDAVTAAKIAPGEVGSSELATDSVDSQHYVAGSIDNEHLAVNSVTGSKIASNSIDSAHYVADSIDRQHIAPDAIGGDEIANSVINSEHYVAGSIDTAHIGTAQVTNAKLASGSVTDDKLDSTAWAALTLGGGVSNFGSGRQTAQWRRVGKRVYLRGSIKQPVSAGNNDNIVTTPVGNRPAMDEAFPVAGSAGNPSMYLILEPGGACRVWNVDNSNIAHLSLSGISYEIA